MPASPILRLIRRTGHELFRRADSAAWREAFRKAGVPDAPSIFSFTAEPELLALYGLAHQAPRSATALEIGSYLGKSACYLAVGLLESGGTLYCVDTWQNETMPDGERDTLAEFRKNTQGVRSIIREVRKRADELTRQDIPTPLDLVFLDGDHSYEAVKADFFRVEPWVAPRGVIAFHDHLYYKGVARLIGEVLAAGEWVVAGTCGDLLWLTRRTPPPAVGPSEKTLI
jgi:predicted O-methyltransferase YrrM